MIQTITEKARSVFKVLPFILIAVACAAAFFVHAVVDRDSDDVIAARSVHQSVKAERTTALEDLKKAAEHLPEYQIYLEKKIETDKAWEELKAVKKEQRFFDFPSLYWFLGEAWALGLLIYCLFNIFMTVALKFKYWKSILIVHGALTYSSLYYTGYLFINAQDFNPILYKLSLLIVASVLILGIYYLVSSYENKFKSVIRNLLHKILVGFHDEGLVSESKVNEYEVFCEEVISETANAV